MHRASRVLLRAPRPRLRIAMSALLIVIGVGMRLLLSPSQSAPPPAAGSSFREAAAPANLRPAPDFEITMYQGQEIVGGNRVRLSQLWKRGKPIVLNFFAGQCPPCRAEMPDFQKLYEAVGKDKYLMLSVDIGPYIGLGSREDGRALLRELKITFPAGTMFEEDILVVYQILGMPTTVFVTSDGKMLRKHTGLLTRGQMLAFTEELLKASRH